MRSVIAYIDEVVKRIDDMPRMAFTKTKDEEQKQRSFNVTLGIMPDYTYTGGGMRMDGVTEDRPAHQAGMIRGDIVTTIGEFKVADMGDYMDCLGKFNPGDSTQVVVIRNEEKITFTVLWD
jgi:S1-C subfamily serine protease